MPPLRENQKPLDTTVIRIGVAACLYIDGIANRRHVSRRVVVNEMIEAHRLLTKSGKWPVKRFD